MRRFLVLMALLVNYAFAEGFFIGSDLGIFNVKEKFERSENFYFGETELEPLTTRAIIDETAFNINLNLGYQWEWYRMYVAYGYTYGYDVSATKVEDSNPSSEPNYEKFNIKSNFYKFLFGYDFTPRFYGPWKGLFGIYTGCVILSPKKFSSIDFSSSESEVKTYELNTGLLYGLKLGALYEFDKHNEMNFGVKFEQISFDGVTKSSSGSIMSIVSTPKYSIQKFGFFVAYIYKF